MLDEAEVEAKIDAVVRFFDGATRTCVVRVDRGVVAPAELEGRHRRPGDGRRLGSADGQLDDNRVVAAVDPRRDAPRGRHGHRRRRGPAVEVRHARGLAAPQVVDRPHEEPRPHAPDAAQVALAHGDGRGRGVAGARRLVAARPGERELDERRDAQLAVEAVEDAAGARGAGRRRHIASLAPPSWTRLDPSQAQRETSP